MGEKKRDDMMIAQSTSLNLITLKSKWIFQDVEMRLNASSYSFESIRARELMEIFGKHGLIEWLRNLSKNIFVGARVKRLFTNSKEGIPYFMPIDLFMFDFKARKWVRKETEDLENWYVNPLTILITQSGTPGRCLLVNKLFKDKVASPNVVRLVPNENGLKIIGYIYAYLNTWMGQAFLTKDQYGAMVKHIEPHHVAIIPIPRITDLEEEINQKILEAHKLREEAQEALIKAERLFCDKLGLPVIKEEDIDYFGSKKSAKAFTLKLQQIFLKNFRLNASSYLPMCLHAESFLKKKEQEEKFKLKRLKDISDKIFTPPRFKRIYVKDRSEGIPLLQGSHIPMVKYFDLKNISKKTEKLDEYIIRENWILVTCSGTIGRVFLTTKFCDGWAATNHMTRIIPSHEVNAGYLTCFLQSLYGFYQLQALVYGGVVEEVGEAGELLGEILIPIPPPSIQEKIGKLVMEAYEKKDQANMIENKAIELFEKKIEEIAK